MTRDLPACTWRAVEQICCHHVSYHFTVFVLKTYFFDCLQRTANVGSSQVFQCEDSSTRRQSAMLSSGVLRLPRCRWIRHMRSSNLPKIDAGILHCSFFPIFNTWVCVGGHSTYGRDFLKSSHTLLKSKVAWFKKLPWQCQWLRMFPIFPSFCHVNVLLFPIISMAFPSSLRPW